MKNRESIRALFGLTQTEIANLLGVSRSQWSMYEIGKRNIPLQAQQRLAALLDKLNHPGFTKRAHAPEFPVEMRQHLKQLLRENEYIQLSIARKIQAAEKKLHTEERRLLFTDVRVSAPADEKAGISDPIVRKSNARDSCEVALMKLLLRQELLEVQKQFLEQKIKMIGNGPKQPFK